VAGYNRIIIMGNLTRDPEFKQLASGQPVCQLGVASNRQYKNKQTGAMVQEVCFIDADVFGPQAESCRQFLQKGRPVLIEGRLKFDSWEGNDGQKRSKYSIVADRVVFLGNGGGAVETDAPEKMSGGASRARSGSMQASAEDMSLDYEPAAAESARKKTTKAAAPELEFKDEPPFQDDLPF
jgi:single-strand DNA-binding protein